MPISGKQLRKERRAAEVPTTAIAAGMGKSRTTVWIIEKSAEVGADVAAEYRRALAEARAAKMAPTDNAA